jgi:S-adenosylmethionine:tRNA ribosyltransferase-isomerase
MHDVEVLAPPDERALHLSDYDFHLPVELIAQTPAAERDAARLLVLDRASSSLRHAGVRDLPQLLRAGDLLIFNDTRVRAARLHCRTASGGAVELLVVAEGGANVWSCLGRPAKRLRAGTALRLPGGGEAMVRERSAAGRYAVEFADTDVGALMAEHGELPLPPYIRRPSGPLPLDRERYQTVFAAHDGAIAAPTAGLHFTPALLAGLDAAGVQRATITLAVGPGTFLPVRTDDVREHRMEPEWAEIPSATAEAIARTRASRGRVIAVGTTTARALESCGGAAGRLWADAFILPGFRFRVIDALLTNFHLPRSTLLMLVSALAGRERILAAYAVAVAERYRFYSYGDAMLIC